MKYNTIRSSVPGNRMIGLESINFNDLTEESFVIDSDDFEGFGLLEKSDSS